MFILQAPAKINWFLHVLNKRKDGYHDIRSLVQCVGLYDTLRFESSDTIEVLTEADIPQEENLVQRAAVMLKEKEKIGKGARITLQKNIPIAAGLGGGSSDAAAALKGLCRLWDIALPPDRLLQLASSLGSDIPFFMGSTPALVEGRGEKVTPITMEQIGTLLLVKPPRGVSAGWAYGEVKHFTSKNNDIQRIVKAFHSGDLSILSPFMVNDLEPPVIRKYPEVGEIKRALMEYGALVSLMSGSGPTVFGLFGSREEAERASGVFPSLWSAVVETLG